LGYRKNLKGSQAEACEDRGGWGRGSAELRQRVIGVEINHGDTKSTEGHGEKN
jgi:hypothetical protein